MIRLLREMTWGGSQQVSVRGDLPLHEPRPRDTQEQGILSGRRRETLWERWKRLLIWLRLLLYRTHFLRLSTATGIKVIAKNTHRHMRRHGASLILAR